MTTIFIALLLSANAATLTWEPPEDNHDITIGYRVYWQLTNPESCPNGARAIHSVDVGKALEYNITTDHSFRKGETYEFQVRAFNSVGESAPSSERVCYQFPGKLSPVDLDQNLMDGSDENAVSLLQYTNQHKENLNESIKFNGFTNFSKPNGPSDAANVYVGLRSGSNGGRIHYLQHRSSEFGNASAGENYRFWKRSKVVNDDKRLRQLPKVPRRPIVARGKDLQVRTHRVQSNKRRALRVSEIAASDKGGIRSKPRPTDKFSDSIAAYLLGIAAMIAAIIGLRKSKSKSK